MTSSKPSSRDDARGTAASPSPASRSALPGTAGQAGAPRSAALVSVPRSAFRVPRSEGLAALYRSWGILDLLGLTIDEVPAQWLQILDMARNLLDGNPIPGVALPDEITDLLERTDDVRYERRRVAKKIASAHHVSPEDPDVRPIEAISELPRVVLSQMMWQYIDPELFFYRVYTHDVLVKEMLPEQVEVEDEEEYVEELVPVPNVHRRRQKVLVLRDTSSSMRDANKAIFAKAVALAYLIKASEEGAEVGDRSFANNVHPRMRAQTREEFGAIARRILGERSVGTTNLAAALDVTMREIRREELGLNPLARAQTEILLISDCENPEQLPPLPPGVTVNTLHLEGGNEGRMLRNYQERLQEVVTISERFVKIDTSALRLPEATRDRWLLMEEVRAAEEGELPEAGPDEEGEPSAVARAARALALLHLYDRMESSRRPGVRTGLRLRGTQFAARLDPALLLRALVQLLRGCASLPLHLIPHHHPRPAAAGPAVHHDPFIVRPRR